MIIKSITPLETFILTRMQLHNETRQQAIKLFYTIIAKHQQYKELAIR